MRKTLCASALVLALCSSAFAGDMGCPPIVIDDTSSPLMTAPSTGIQTIDGSTAAGASDPTADSAEADGFAAFTLSIVNSVLALL